MGDYGAMLLWDSGAKPLAGDLGDFASQKLTNEDISGRTT